VWVIFKATEKVGRWFSGGEIVVQVEIVGVSQSFQEKEVRSIDKTEV
jgi:hypothetical protein